GGRRRAARGWHARHGVPGAMPATVAHGRAERAACRPARDRRRARRAVRDARAQGASRSLSQRAFARARPPGGACARLRGRARSASARRAVRVARRRVGGAMSGRAGRAGQPPSRHDAIGDAQRGRGRRARRPAAAALGQSCADPRRRRGRAPARAAHGGRARRPARGDRAAAQSGVSLRRIADRRAHPRRDSAHPKTSRASHPPYRHGRGSRPPTRMHYSCLQQVGSTGQPVPPPRTAYQGATLMKILTSAACVVWLLGAGASAQTLDDLKKDGNGGSTDNILTYGMGYHQQRYSPLKEINKQTVKRLVPVWNLSLDNNWGGQAQPIVYAGVMYVTDAKATVAIDVATGKQIWKQALDWPPETPRVVCCGVSNKGAAIYNGKVFRTTLDAHVIAYDAKDGKELWKSKAAEWK